MSLLDDVFAVISTCPERHPTHDPMWRLLQASARPEIEKHFAETEPKPVPFGPFDAIAFPYHKMGNIDSLDLFGMDELIIFAFYHANRARYRRAVDFGANIGLHSLMMARCGFEVRSFEPDPVHFALLESNLSLNDAASELHRAAVSLEAGQTEFVRVLGNTTGSHIAGAKDSPYGELERFQITLEAAAPHLAWADFAKIDIEGHEAVLLTGLEPSVWETTDAILEIGTADNAAAIFEHMHGSGINMFAQKIGWRRVAAAEDMPASHREGSVFLSASLAMPWAGD